MLFVTRISPASRGTTIVAAAANKHAHLLFDNGLWTLYSDKSIFSGLPKTQSEPGLFWERRQMETICYTGRVLLSLYAWSNLMTERGNSPSGAGFVEPAGRFPSAPWRKER